MNCDQLKKIVKESLATLIDVRTPREFQTARLQGAVNIPLADIDNIKQIISKEEIVLLYCQSGIRSEHAKNHLSALGYDARNIGGIVHHPQCVEF